MSHRGLMSNHSQQVDGGLVFIDRKPFQNLLKYKKRLKRLAEFKHLEYILFFLLGIKDKAHGYVPVMIIKIKYVAISAAQVY